MTRRRSAFGAAAAVVLALTGLGGGVRAAPAPDREVAAFVRALGDADRGVRYSAAVALGRAAEPDPDAIAALAARLSDPEWCVRTEAARALAAIGGDGLAPLGAALRASNAAFRRVVIRALADGRAGPEQFEPALADPDEVVRFLAADAILRMDPARADETVPVFTGLLASKNGETALLAARRLARARPGAATAALPILAERLVAWGAPAPVLDDLAPYGEAAVAAVRKALAKADERTRALVEPALRWLAGERLAPEAPEPPGGGAKASPPAKAALVARLTGDDPVERAVAAAELARPDAGDPVADLVGLLSGASVPGRRAAARALGAMGPRAGAAREALDAALADPDPGVRGAAADAIGAVDAGAGVPPDGLTRLARSQSRGDRIRAAAALGRIGPGAVDPLRSLLADESWRVRRLAAEALAGIGPGAAPAAPELVRRLADPWLAVETAAAEALARIGAPAAAALAPALASPDERILAFADRLFERWGPAGAPAVGALTGLLASPDVNARSVAAKALGEIGPDAAAAIPGLVRALADVRIPVRNRAAVALGRIGEAATDPLLDAARSDDARVRAGAVYALGIVVGTARGVPFVPHDIRIPMADPGPPDPGDPLRPGLRAADVRDAVKCAAGLDEKEMTEREAERAVELLLPECFTPGPDAGIGGIIDVLGSSEVGAALEFMIHQDPLCEWRDSVSGECHRIVRPELIPLIAALDLTPGGVDLEGLSDVRFERYWSDRDREISARTLLRNGPAAPPPPPGSGLPPLLARLLPRVPTLDEWERTWILRWLADSRPSDADAGLLIDCARRLEAVPGAARDTTSGRGALVRALGFLHDARSRRFLEARATAGSGLRLYALAALARRGDPAAIRELAGEAAGDPDALGELLEVRPGLGREIVRDQLLGREPDPPALELEENFVEFTFLGIHWPETVFAGLAEEVAAAGLPPGRLAWIAVSVPGCRTVRIAKEAIEGLGKTTPRAAGLVAPEEDGDYLPLDPEGPFAFLEAADRDGLVALLRSWSALPDAADREWAMRRLAWLGDPASAKQIVAFVRSAPVADDGGSPMAWLSRTGGPIVEAYLRGVVADDAAEPARRVHALADLAVLYGATEAEVSALELFDGPESTAKALRALVLDRRPGAAIEAARAAVEDPGERSVPTETGERALAGDPAARRDLWESFRVGRYRWICYENDWNALTLGYDPVTYPQLLTELETNCCRGGHVARMFERLMGADTLSYQPEGMDATPRRRAATWLALYGGRFVKSRLAGDGTPDEGWTSAAE